MASGAPAENHYPSTPQSIPEEFSGLQQIVNHNAMTSRQYGEYGATDPYQTGSGYNSTQYGSPASNQWIQDGQMNERGADFSFMRGNEMGYSWHDDPLDAGPGTYVRPYPTYAVVPGEASFARLTPPTPATSDHSGMEQRRNRGANRSGLDKETKSRQTRKTVKKKEKDKPSKAVRPPAGPISVLSKDSKVPIEDIEALVRRPAEHRAREADKARGHWKRPMNNFMLYRKAYWKRMQELDGTNNHQKISSLLALSWHMEPSEVVEQFTEYSRIDKAGLLAANPAYKFEPKAKPGKKRKGEDMDSEDEGYSDLDQTSKQARTTAYPHDHPKNNNIYAGARGGYGWEGGYQRSVYQSSNPGRPLPAPMNNGRSHPAYRPQQMQHGVHGGIAMDDLPYSEPFGSVMYGSTSGSAPTGVPGTGDHLLNDFDNFHPDFEQAQNMRAGLVEPLDGIGAFTGEEFMRIGQEGAGHTAWAPADDGEERPRDLTFTDIVDEGRNR